MIAVIGQLDTLGLLTRKTKNSHKAGKFDAKEMVYLIKWSGVSWEENGEVVREEEEKHFYNYMQTIYKGNYEFPSWAAVCGERKFCKEVMSLSEMVNAFAEHLPS